MDPLLLFIDLPENRGLPLIPGERAAQRIQPFLRRTMKRPTASAWRSRSVVGAIPVAWSRVARRGRRTRCRSPLNRRQLTVIRSRAPSLRLGHEQFAISHPAMGTILVGMATPQPFEHALAAVQRVPCHPPHLIV